MDGAELRGTGVLLLLKSGCKSPAFPECPRGAASSLIPLPRAVLAWVQSLSPVLDTPKARGGLDPGRPPLGEGSCILVEHRFLSMLWVSCSSRTLLRFKPTPG